MRFIGTAAIIIFFILIHPISLLAEGSTASDKMVAKLYTAVCHDPSHLISTGLDNVGLGCLVIGKNDVDEEGDPKNGPYPGSTCAVAFQRQQNERSPVRVWSGRFAENRPQTAVMYWGCEGHFNNFGGMAIFNKLKHEYKISEFYPGNRMEDCVVANASANKDALFCFSAPSVHQGELAEGFGPIVFKDGGKAEMDTWLTATNIDNMIGPTVDCNDRKAIHHLESVHISGAIIELMGTYLDPKDAKIACDRMNQNDFSEKEKITRDIFPRIIDDRGFIRKDEQNFLKAKIIFHLPNRKPDIVYTDIQVDKANSYH